MLISPIVDLLNFCGTRINAASYLRVVELGGLLVAELGQDSILSPPFSCGGLSDLFAYLRQNQPRRFPFGFKFPVRIFQDFIHLVVIGCHILGLRQERSSDPSNPAYY